MVRTARKHWVAFLVTLLACVGSVFLINELVRPQYQASASLVATISSAESGTYNEFLASQMLTKTYEDAIQSRFIANEAKNKLHTRESAYDLLKRIEVRTDPGTLVVVLYAKHDNPEDAVAIANAFAESFISKAKEIVQSANVTVLDYANLEDASIPVSPKKLFNLAISGFIGTFAALGVALLLEKRDANRRRRRRPGSAELSLLFPMDESGLDRKERYSDGEGFAAGK